MRSTACNCSGNAPTKVPSEIVPKPRVGSQTWMENIERLHIREAFIAQYLGTLGNRFLLVVAIARFWWTGWPARALAHAPGGEKLD